MAREAIIHIRVTREVENGLKKWAIEEGRSMSGLSGYLLSRALEKYLKAKKRGIVER